MIDFFMSYRASVFTDTIEASSENISKLLMLFVDRGFLPNVYNEQIPSVGGFGPTQIPIGPLSVLELKSNDGKFIIKFGQGRIDIVMTMPSPSVGVGDINVFLEEADNCFKIIFAKFPRTFSRLAFASNALLKILPEDKLNDLYLSLISPVEFYSENIPVEWNIRQVAKNEIEINDNKELMNVVCSLSRSLVTINENGNISNSNRIIIDFDINTVPENMEKRFSMEQYNSFISTALDCQNRILEEYKLMIYGDKE